MGVQRPTRETLSTDTLEVDLGVQGIDLERLRRLYAGLFDRAARAVQIAGYEQDDAVLDRYLLVRMIDRDTVATVPVAVLSDGLRFEEHLVRCLPRASGDPINLADLRIVGLRVDAVLERWS